MINVKVKEGRKAFYEGRAIPHDKFISVVEDAYIRRLIDHWGDLEVEGGEVQPAVDPSPRQSRRGSATPPGTQSVAPEKPQRVTQPAPQAVAPGTGAPKPTN